MAGPSTPPGNTKPGDPQTPPGQTGKDPAARTPPNAPRTQRTGSVVRFLAKTPEDGSNMDHNDEGGGGHSRSSPTPSRMSSRRSTPYGSRTLDRARQLPMGPRPMPASPMRSPRDRAASSPMSARRLLFPTPPARPGGPRPMRKSVGRYFDDPFVVARPAAGPRNEVDAAMKDAIPEEEIIDDQHGNNFSANKEPFVLIDRKAGSDAEMKDV